MPLLRDTKLGKASRRLRRLFADGPLPLLGVWGSNANHAQLAEATGFQFFGISGSDLSTQVLGLPDVGLISSSELLDATRLICKATTLPVIVDCDTGFGNAITVHRTVADVIDAGAACLFIEDQVSPKRCGFVKGKEIVGIEEAVGKFRAACDVRDKLDPDFMIMARTDARGAAGGGMDEVMKRSKAYLDAGADILYVSALQSRDELRAVREAFPDVLLECLPLALDTPLTQKEIEEFRLCTCGVHIARVGAIMMHDFLIQYRKSGEDAYNAFATKHKGHALAGFGLLELTGLPGILELERRYLPADVVARKGESVGLVDLTDPSQTAENAGKTR